jgi:DNA ligase-1
MGTIIKPMLAQAVTEKQLYELRYPMIVQIKYDGIRGLVLDGKLYSRSGKLLPNSFIQQFFCELHERVPYSHGLDGEIVIGEPNDEAVCMTTTSGVMSYGGEPNFKFYAFDLIRPGAGYNRRREALQTVVNKIHEAMGSEGKRVQLAVEYQEPAASKVIDRLDSFIGQGLEGGILRDPEGVYKHGRSTLRQQALLKYKDIADDEAIVVGFDELHHNLNTAFKDELGFQKRSSHKAFKAAGGKLGALVVRSPKWPGEFRIGTGFDDANRYHIWDNRETYLHQVVKFKYLKAGMKNVPRHPVFLNFRNPADMDPIQLQILRALIV